MFSKEMGGDERRAKVLAFPPVRSTMPALVKVGGCLVCVRVMKFGENKFVQIFEASR